MHYFVYIDDFNSKTIKPYDIFKHSSFAQAVDKLKKQNLPKNEFSDKLRRELLYYFWGKTEWETMFTSWPPYVSTDELFRLNKECERHRAKWGNEPRMLCANLTVSEKISIYDQVMLNFNNIFLDYVYSYEER